MSVIKKVVLAGVSWINARVQHVQRQLTRTFTGYRQSGGTDTRGSSRSQLRRDWCVDRINDIQQKAHGKAVLTRPSSDHEFPSSVKVAKVDYDSVDSLTEAIGDNDAVISTITTTAVSLQKNLLDASLKAGIKRFIPSEFGSDTLNPKTRKLPVYKQKVEIQDYIAEKCKGTETTYTFVINNCFLDWGLSANFLLKLKEHAIELYDGGEGLYSATRLSTIAKGVVGVLKNPKETENRAIYIQDLAISQKKLLEIAQRVTPGQKWTATEVSTAEQEKWGYEELQKPEPQMWPAMFAFLKRAIWGEGYGGHFAKNDNALLGIEDMKEEELEELLKSMV